MNLNTCSFVIWGWKKDSIDSFKHIFEAFYRALEFMGKQVLWLDWRDDISGINFNNTFFISMSHSTKGMPRRKDCFYAIHNAGEIPTKDRKYLQDLRMMNYGANWGTDLLPHEIEANKPSIVFRCDSKVINYIGCSSDEYKENITPFKKAAEGRGIAFNHISHGNVSIEENVRLIRESYMAPAIVTPFHLKSGYLPCRIFKNISYGQYGITNSIRAAEMFENKLIYNSNTEALFYQAQNQLPEISLTDLYSLMDEVAAKHTFLNRVETLLAAARITMESRP